MALSKRQMIDLDAEGVAYNTQDFEPCKGSTGGKVLV
jgi:hypothetical protein